MLYIDMAISFLKQYGILIAIGFLITFHFSISYKLPQTGNLAESLKDGKSDAFIQLREFYSSFRSSSDRLISFRNIMDDFYGFKAPDNYDAWTMTKPLDRCLQFAFIYAPLFMVISILLTGGKFELLAIKFRPVTDFSYLIVLISITLFLIYLSFTEIYIGRNQPDSNMEMQVSKFVRALFIILAISGIVLGDITIFVVFFVASISAYAGLNPIAGVLGIVAGIIYTSYVLYDNNNQTISNLTEALFINKHIIYIIIGATSLAIYGLFLIFADVRNGRFENCAYTIFIVSAFIISISYIYWIFNLSTIGTVTEKSQYYALSATSLVIFLVSLPLINSLWDFFSVYITRNIIDMSIGGEISAARSLALDTLFSIIMFVFLFISMMLSFLLINYISQGTINQDVVSISNLTKANLGEFIYGEYIWLTLIIATVLMPTVIHVSIYVVNGLDSIILKQEITSLIKNYSDFKEAGVIIDDTQFLKDLISEKSNANELARAILWHKNEVTVLTLLTGIIVFYLYLIMSIICCQFVMRSISQILN